MNQQNLKQTSFEFECKVDTGFTGGIYAEEVYRSDAQMVGVTPAMTVIRLGDGSPAPTYVCAAYIQKIEDYEFPSPGKSVLFYMRGHAGFRYLGMEALRYWITEINGPGETIKIQF